MSPAMPEKQWNQAIVTAGWLPGSCGASGSRGAAGAHLEQPQDRARRPVAVVDADHGDAGCARRQHRQQRGDALQRGAVAHRGRHRHDRRRHEAAEHAGQRALHAGDHHDRVEILETVEHGEQAVQAGDPDVGQVLGAHAVSGQHRQGLLGHRAVRSPGRDHRHRRVEPRRRGPPGDGRAPTPAPGHRRRGRRPPARRRPGSAAPARSRPPAARSRWRCTARPSCRARRPPPPSPGAAPGDGRCGCGRGRRRAAAGGGPPPPRGRCGRCGHPPATRSGRPRPRRYPAHRD